MPSRQYERSSGALIAVLGVGGILMCWHKAYVEYKVIYSSLVAPCSVLVGLGLIAFPSPQLERIRRGEVVDCNRFDFGVLMPRWMMIAIAGLILGIGYSLFLDYSSGQALEAIMQG